MARKTNKGNSHSTVQPAQNNQCVRAQDPNPLKCHRAGGRSELQHCNGNLAGPHSFTHQANILNLCFLIVSDTEKF